ncbi:MAG: hypothetical protein HOQ24_18485, partial [Mycobacteriaceae bacterium]|nr:hypothetical protein [Mycobacteriaceae bacterium]
ALAGVQRAADERLASADDARAQLRLRAERAEAQLDALLAREALRSPD